MAIAADTLVTFGDTRLSHRHEANSSCSRSRWWAARLGRHGLAPWRTFPVLRKAMDKLPSTGCGWQQARCSTPVRPAPLLKETFFP